jgi:hypothetical protein
MLKYSLILFFSIAIFYSCKKDLNITSDPSAKLEFSTDTVLFDTVFTTMGSTTKRLIVHNRNKNAISISSIDLIDETAFAKYRLNVDGIPGNHQNDIEIAGNDSMFVFIEITVTPNGETNPFLVNEELVFNTNGNTQRVQVVSYGENAHFYNDSVLTGNVVWTNDLPYVIVNDVLVDSNSTLTLDAGVRVYMSKGSDLFVSGTLKVNGTKEDSVTFQGVRREKIYYDEPGQWDGIHILRGSTNNEINYATIKGAIQGIRVDSLPENSNPNLILRNSILKYMEVAGLVGFNAKIEADNNLFFACGQYSVVGLYGGDYQFIFNTFSGNSMTINRQTATVTFTDYIETSSGDLFNPLSIELVNNIIYGNLEQELLIEKKSVPLPLPVVEYNLIKTKASLPATNIKNQNPQFTDSSNEDFHLEPESPAKNKGTFIPSLNFDRDGKIRNNPPSMGCYEGF